MLDAAYWTAAALALGFALYGRRRDRVTWALLASAGFCLIARWTALPFHFALWLAVDVAVCAVILWPVLWRAWPSPKELAILMLFPLMWAAYALPGEPAYIFTTIASAAQLLLTLPLAAVFARMKRASKQRDTWNEFDLAVRA